MGAVTVATNSQGFVTERLISNEYKKEQRISNEYGENYLVKENLTDGEDYKEYEVYTVLE